VAGARGMHNPERAAVRHGTGKGSVTLVGRRVAVSRSRARTLDGHEVPLAVYSESAADDLLGQVVLERMLAGSRPAGTPDRRAGRQSRPDQRELDGPVGGVAPVRQGDRDRAGRAAGP